MCVYVCMYVCVCVCNAMSMNVEGTESSLEYSYYDEAVELSWHRK